MTCMPDDFMSEALDEFVHDLKSKEASEINNAGLEAQLAYLGLTRKDAEIIISEGE